MNNFTDRELDAIIYALVIMEVTDHMKDYTSEELKAIRMKVWDMMYLNNEEQ